MPKYLIHTYPKRKWYVDGYILRQMHEQGIPDEDISTYVDTEGKGNLQAFLDTCDLLKDVPGGTWHLQDDVFLCHDFAERTKKYDKHVVCGFCYEACERGLDASGERRPDFMWYSFPCIRIPNHLLGEFAHWIRGEAMNFSPWVRLIKGGKSDDLLFKMWLETFYKKQIVINLKPNLVDHVDYLLGGSICNKERGPIETRAWFFDDLDGVKALEKELKNREE